MLRIAVLAAGYSTRLGQPKALAAVHGSSLLKRTMRVLAACAPATGLLVVIPPRCGRYRIGLDVPHAEFVENSRRAGGLSSSIHAAIRHNRYAAGVLLLPVDLVELRSRDIARLISMWRAGRRKVVATRIGDRAATPLILPHALFGRALGIFGDQGLREMVRSLPHDSVRLLTLPSTGADVDTPEDLERARRRLRTGLPQYGRHG